MISIVKIDSTKFLSAVQQQMRKLVDELDYEPKKDRVFIKPNMVDAVGPREAVDTDPILVGGLILALNEKSSISEFVIADGSAYFSSEDKNWKRLVEETGYLKLVERLKKEHGLNVHLENLENADRASYKWKYGEISLPTLCTTHSYINFAKMKTHLHTMVTLSLKNQKGLLKLKDKKNFHLGKKYGSLHESINELSKIMKPELVLIDATKALEGTGPATAPEGQTKVRRLKLCLGGTDMMELDNAACRIMGIPVNLVSHLVEREVSLSAGSLPLEPADPPFIRPKIEVKMWNIYRHTFETCCTGCQMALSRTFRKIMFIPELRKYFSLFQEKNPRVDLIMGDVDSSIIEGIQDLGGKLIFFGNCTKNLAKKFNGVHIPGCSPDHNKAIEIIFADFIQSKASLD
ncbi:MAG: DUF362 domain-containing protein [Promethearchaeota archaeon]